jgi:peroxiredoxin
MRMINKIGLAASFIFLYFSLSGAEIRFSNVDYSGDPFSFYTVPNFLTETHEIIGDGTVDEEGFFSCELDITEEIAVYTEFGVYKGWFILKPDDSIELSLPPKQEKKSSNPYFRLKQIHLGLKKPSPDNTNFLISNFTRHYNVQMSQNIKEIMYRRSVEKAEEVIGKLKEQFTETDNEYFENYKRYKYASIKYTAQIQEPQPVIDEYFINQDILYAHSGYAELFHKIFGNYLKYATQQVNGQKISVMLNSGAHEQLINWLTLDMGFNVALAEAIILKGIKPIFYSKRFNTVGLFSILQKISDDSETPIHKETASSIFNELARTMYGTIAPELDVADINGEIVTWDNFTGKYVYLCFTRTDNEKFIPHKNLMKEFQQKFSEDLAIVVVLEDDKIVENAELLKSEGFEWSVLRGQTRREIYQDYNVRILPTYFLVDPKGRMAGSQAPWPDENFEMQFENILNATKTQ